MQASGGSVSSGVNTYLSYTVLEVHVRNQAIHSVSSYWASVSTVDIPVTIQGTAPTLVECL